jgi:hypothetical protein
MGSVAPGREPRLYGLRAVPGLRSARFRVCAKHTAAGRSGGARSIGPARSDARPGDPIGPIQPGRTAAPPKSRVALKRRPPESRRAGRGRRHAPLPLDDRGLEVPVAPSLRTFQSAVLKATASANAAQIDQCPGDAELSLNCSGQGYYDAGSAADRRGGRLVSA